MTLIELSRAKEAGVQASEVARRSRKEDLAGRVWGSAGIRRGSF